MRSTWVIIFCVCLLMMTCIANQAALGATWTSAVTVLVEDNQHNLPGISYVCYRWSNRE